MYSCMTQVIDSMRRMMRICTDNIWKGRGQCFLSAFGLGDVGHKARLHEYFIRSHLMDRINTNESRGKHYSDQKTLSSCQAIEQLRILICICISLSVLVLYCCVYVHVSQYCSPFSVQPYIQLYISRNLWNCRFHKQKNRTRKYATFDAAWNFGRGELRQEGNSKFEISRSDKPSRVRNATRIHF